MLNNSNIKRRQNRGNFLQSLLRVNKSKSSTKFGTDPFEDASVWRPFLLNCKDINQFTNLIWERIRITNGTKMYWVWQHLRCVVMFFTLQPNQRILLRNFVDSNEEYRKYHRVYKWKSKRQRNQNTNSYGCRQNFIMAEPVLRNTVDFMSIGDQKNYLFFMGTEKWKIDVALVKLFLDEINAKSAKPDDTVVANNNVDQDSYLNDSKDPKDEKETQVHIDL